MYKFILKNWSKSCYFFIFYILTIKQFTLSADAPRATKSADTLTSRFLNWHHLTTTINEILVTKKNILVAYPFAISTTLIDVLCSSTIYIHHVPRKITPDIEKIHFQYITACKNYSVPLLEAEKLWQDKSFSKQKKIVILATGWTNTVNDSTALHLLSQAFMCRNDVNFIVVDTASYVDTLYKWAALNTEEIGQHIALGLTHLVKLVPLRNIHLIGHSLGAHIMGSAGRTFKKFTGKLIPRITGLDPAKPCFRKHETLASLQRSDAVFVDIIHTNIGILAKREPIGNMDFYPGGANPLSPGCLSIGCSHMRAVEYFAESVYPQNEHNFLARKCDSWKSLKKLNCFARKTFTMGYSIKQRGSGIFYVDVNRKSPFGKNSNSIKEVFKKCNFCKNNL